MSPHVRWLRSLVGNELLVLPSVTVLVENGRGEILLVRNRGARRWSTLGGMVEPGEHPATTAVREVAEEAGLTVELTALAHASGGPGCIVEYPNGDRVSYVTTVYRARPTDGDGAAAAADGDEIAELRWVAPGDLTEVDLDRFARQLFTEMGHLGDDDPTAATGRAVAGDG